MHRDVHVYSDLFILMDCYLCAVEYWSIVLYMVLFMDVMLVIRGYFGFFCDLPMLKGKGSITSSDPLF